MKKTYLPLPFFLIVFVASSVFCQNPCDTLVTKDGRLIAAEIIQSGGRGILYQICGDSTGRQYFIDREKVAKVKPPNRQVLKSASKSKALKEPMASPEPSVLKKETNLNKPKTILWAGFTTPSLFLFDFENEGIMFIQFGAEFGLEDTPVRLGLVAQPIFNSTQDFGTDLKNIGINGEIGLILKKFARGRLTGNVSNVYWGLDVRTGRHEYSYVSTPNARVVKYHWFTIMPRIGYQYTYGMFALDLALPIGYQSYGYTDSYANDNTYSGGTLDIRPSISFGFRF